MDKAAIYKRLKRNDFQGAMDLINNALIETNPILNPAQCEDALRPYQYKPQEHFLVLSLDTQSKLISISCVGIGSINQVVYHPREIFRAAVYSNAFSIIIAHSHPSGALHFDKDDIALSNRINMAGIVMGIPLVDHIVFGRGNQISLVETIPDIFEQFERINSTTPFIHMNGMEDALNTSVME